MQFKNVIAASVLLLIVGSASMAGCKPRCPSTTTDGGVGGANSSVGPTVSSTAVGSTTVTSTSSGTEVTAPCVKGCPETLPNTGDTCDALADMYCEYAGSVCKAANCNSVTAVWEVGDLNPCMCYSGPPVSVEVSK